MTGDSPELWTTTQAAEYLGASSAGSGRKTLSRLRVAPVSREPGRAGQNLYDAARVRAVKAEMPGRGRRAIEPTLVPDEGPMVTKTGRVLTDHDAQALADEAERGYDIHDRGRHHD